MMKNVLVLSKKTVTALVLFGLLVTFPAIHLISGDTQGTDTAYSLNEAITKTINVLSYSLGSNCINLTFLEGIGDKPVINVEMSHQDITIRVKIPRLSLFYENSSARAYFTSCNDVFCDDNPIIPSLVLRYAVPSDAKIISCEATNIRGALLKNLNLMVLSEKFLKDSMNKSPVKKLYKHFPKDALNGTIFKHIEPDDAWCGNKIGTIVIYPLQYNMLEQSALFYYDIVLKVKYTANTKITSFLSKKMLSDKVLNIARDAHNLPEGLREKDIPRLVYLGNAPRGIKQSIIEMSIWGKENKKVIYTVDNLEDLKFYQILNDGSNKQFLNVTALDDLLAFIRLCWKEINGFILASGSDEIIGNSGSIASFLSYPLVVLNDLEDSDIIKLLDFIKDAQPNYLILTGNDEGINRIYENLRNLNGKIIRLKDLTEIIDWFAMERSITGYNTKVYAQEEELYYRAANVVNYEYIKSLQTNYENSILAASIDYVVIYDSSDDDAGVSYYEPASRLKNYRNGIMIDGNGYSFWYIRDNIIKNYKNNYNALYFALMGDGDDKVDSNGGSGNNGGEFDIPSRFIDYPWTDPRAESDPPKLPTDFFYEEINELTPDPIGPLASWNPDCYIGRVISTDVTNTKKYVDISWAYWIGEIDTRSTYGGQFWRYNAHYFIYNDPSLELFEGTIRSALYSVNFIRNAYGHLDNAFSTTNAKDAIGGSTSHTGSIVWFKTHGSEYSICTNDGYLSTIYETINHRYPFVILDACLCGGIAGPGWRDNSKCFASNVLKNAIGCIAHTVTARNMYSTNVMKTCVAQLNSHYFGGAVAFGRKNYWDSSLRLDYDKRAVESLILFGDPKNGMGPMKVDIKISSLSINLASSFPDSYLGSKMTITASGYVNNDKAWSNVGVKFYLDNNQIGYKESGSWIESGSWTVSYEYTLPTSLSLGSHIIKAKALDSDYWVDNFPSYTGGDIDLDGNNPNDWPYCDFYIDDNEKTISITIYDDDASSPSYSNPSAEPSGTIYDNYSSYIRFKVYWSDSSGISNVKFEFWKGSNNIGVFPYSSRSVDSYGNGWYWFDMPLVIWKDCVGYKIYWASYAWDNDNDRPNDMSGPAYTSVFEGPSILDDDTASPSFSNAFTSPSGTIYDTYTGYIRLQIDWSDSSGIYEVKFRYSYGSGSWLGWFPPSGVSGNTYWYDIPRSEWINYVGQTIYWESYATDNDNDRDGDRLSRYTSTFTGPTIVDDDSSPPSGSNAQPPAGTVFRSDYTGNIRISVNWVDSLSGIYQVRFYYKYGGGSWLERPPSGQSGSTYWYDIPRSEWSQHAGETIYWYSKAWDNDNDRTGDQSTAECPSSSSPYTIKIESTISEKVYLTVRDLNNGIYYRVFDVSSGSWGSWSALPGATCDGPAATVCCGRLHLVVRGADGSSLWYGSVDLATNAFSGWSRLSGSTPSAPTLTSNGTHLFLVVRGSNNYIYYRIFNCGSNVWSSWYAIPTGATLDRPAATVCGGKLHIVVRGVDGQSLWHGTVNLPGMSFSGWTRLSGSTPSAPTLTSNGATLYLVVRGSYNRIYYRSYANGAWGNWQSIPSGTTCDSPAATIVNNQLHLVVRGMDGQSLWHAHINLPTNSFSGWTKISGATSSAPTLTTKN